MKVFFTITGLDHYHGSGFLKPDMRVKLVKEPDNKYDHEAIRVEMDGLGKIGYVANSVKTVIGESYSAGRLYDKIGISNLPEIPVGEVLYVLDDGVLCTIDI